MRARAVTFLSFVAGLWLGVRGIADGQTITEFTIPTAQTEPGDIAAGPDGNLWFTEVTYASGPGPRGPVELPSSAAIARISPTGVITEFTFSDGLFPNSITLGPYGNLWFPETGLTGGYRLSRITPSGVITQFEIFLSSSFGLGDIATGPDGNLWGTEIGPSIARITTAGASAEFALPPMANVSKIVSGPDGNMWFTDGGTNQIGRITTSGDVTEYSIPTPNSGPFGISLGPDGNLWFTESTGNKIGRITPAGAITEFPAIADGSSPLGIAAGPDGNMWFTEALRNKIGRISMGGAVNEFAVPTPRAQPWSITAGPDGNLWFTESALPVLGGSQRQKIGRITTSGPVTPTCPADAHTLCLNNGRFAVAADFQTTPDGPSAPATAVPLTSDTGYFWFFDHSNVEVVTKVLEGCSTNGHFWFFASGLTNVGVQISVTDTLTGASKPYSNPVGTAFQPIQDTAAFPCP